MRLLFWLLLAVIVYFAIRSRARSMQQNLRRSAEFQAQAAMRRAGGQQATQAASQPVAPAEKMVECSHCHVYLPTSEAIQSPPQLAPTSERQFFCCEEHLRLHSTAATTSNQQAND